MTKPRIDFMHLLVTLVGKFQSLKRLVLDVKTQPMKPGAEEQYTPGSKTAGKSAADHDPEMIQGIQAEARKAALHFNQKCLSTSISSPVA